MKRNALEHLTSWLRSPNRKPLVIRGARQVGKSTLVRIFAEQVGLRLIEINLEKVRLSSLKSENVAAESVIAEIESLEDVSLSAKTLLFFDEIQQQPRLLPVLRYFYEEHAKIPVVAAGSLLEFLLQSHEFSMPVGRIEYFHLSPMSFFEFLTALGKSHLLQQVQKSIPHIQTHHFEQLTEYIKIYFFVGGMPEAIKVFAESQNHQNVRRVHRSIVQTYRDDFAKYSSKAMLPRIDLVFDRLPQVIGKKVKYSEISKEFQSRDIRGALALLHQARLLHFCYHTNATGLPLKAQMDTTVYKIYFLDVGLFNYMCDVSWQSLQDFTDESLLTKGMIAEQFAAQHLAYRQNGLEEPNLLYWLRDKKEENAEVDFVISHKNQIIPIEIKSGLSGRLKSLVQFVKQKRTKQAYRFDLKNRSKDSIDEKVTHSLAKADDTEKITFGLRNLHLGLIETLNDES